ncbi:uncharacterized protein LOC131928065 [Physella acuta]|uniref:uncharacterized protein LOC131928065 n=1 Tax=Physella acuta TaxID=109671 RepID=UPI0027DBE879|nr:uncharacterized protein LOC131928065 [Physella acuta]
MVIKGSDKELLCCTIYLALLMFSAVVADDACQLFDGFTFVNGYCLKVFNVQFKWQEAEAFCKTRLYGGKLIEILTEEDRVGLQSLITSKGVNYTYFQNFCTVAISGGSLAEMLSEQEKSVVKNLVVTNGQPAWLGGRFSSGTYNWTLAPEVPIPQNIWCYYEPNNFGGAENCVRAETGACLNDGQCGDLLPFICQSPNNSCSSSSGLMVNGKCYTVVNTTLQWADALQYCKARGGTLMELLTDRDYTFLRSIPLLNTSYIWVGGSDLKEEGKFLWAGTQTAIRTNWWGFEMPDNNLGTEGALEMLNFGFLNDEPRVNNKSFVCQRVWIGANDLQLSRYFRWVTGNQSIPSGTLQLSSLGEHCLAWRRSGTGVTWEDRTCEESHGFVCMTGEYTCEGGDFFEDDLPPVVRVGIFEGGEQKHHQM